MKYVILVLISVLTVLTDCQEVDTAVEIPACMEWKIRDIRKADVQNPPAEVWKWEDAGKTYYYSTADCCDQFSSLYDTHCDVVCAPDGGLTGTGDGNCPTFSEDKKMTLIWKDNRP